MRFTATGAAGTCGCATPRSLQGAEQARLQFSSDDYCPLDRVVAARVIPIPTPPPAIARDPERLAMWQQAAERAAHTDPRQTIAVSGCGDRATYWCWNFEGQVGPPGRGKARKVSIGAACNPRPGGYAPDAVAPPVPITRSTTEGPAPNTSASSR